MSTITIRLADELPALSALGVQDPAELFEPGGAPDRRGEPTADGSGAIRFPLPGTPDLTGRLTGRPREAGTGWVVLQRWHRPGWGQLLRSRFTHPRSTSMAEREWNLLAVLLRHGVAVPRPLAVGTRGHGLVARTSFLVKRELLGFEPLATFLRHEHRPAPRRRALRALGTFLANLLRAGVFLPRISVADLRLKAEAHDDEACEAEAPTAGMRLRRMPGVALLEVTDGVLRERTTQRELLAMLARLADEALREGLVDPGEADRVGVRALRGHPRRRELRRALLARTRR